MSRAKMGLLVLLVAASGCANDHQPREENDGGVDSGVGPKVDGGGGPLSDGGPATYIDSAVAMEIDGAVKRHMSCEAEINFLSSHRTCTKHDDCVIVGSCSGGFGFRAVERSAKAEAQSLSDRTACGPTFDGPTYAAVCEQGLCTTRPNGGGCGVAQRDSGVYGCPPGQEQYLPTCDTPFSQGWDTKGCETHCDGSDDTRCAAGLACKQVKVVSATRASCPNLIDTWLCRPAP